MRLNHPYLIGFGGLLAFHALRALFKRLDVKYAYYEYGNDPGFPDCIEPNIFLFWHEYMLFPPFTREQSPLSILMSQHSDADILGRIGVHARFSHIRGSTSRGNISSLRKLKRLGTTTHLAFPPDGPRGPRREMAMGAVYVASRVQMPITLMGIGYDRPYRFKSWDRFAIPRPYSRARCLFSESIRVPSKLDREGLEYYQQKIERVMHLLTDEAEAWAESGKTMPGETHIIPGKQPRHGIYWRSVQKIAKVRNPD